ncbi:MAG: SUMF1/EgtB/PvdO family nonheme iron enzyme [bacterium]|nr:SUMF1/EgtB/PvdO family nonheme iron enzyme [bacterium]
MRIKRLVRTVLAGLIVMVWMAVILPVSMSGQGKEADNSKGDQGFEVVKLIPYAIALAGLIFGLYQYLKRRRDVKLKVRDEDEEKEELQSEKQEKAALTAEEIYCASLEEELGTLQAPDSPDFETEALTLDEVFVSLRISEQWRSDRRYDGDNDSEKEELPGEMEREQNLSPGEVMERAFQKYRLLLIIGDPGSGKTTLLKYYAMRCLESGGKGFAGLGFKSPVMPLYFPLRELEFKSGEATLSLPDILARWARRHKLKIKKDTFYNWLHKRDTLVLLDGLEEVGDKEQRKRVCNWVNDIHNGLTKARFVLTSCATGYRAVEGIQLKPPHLRADIMDFSSDQQEEFLSKWFRAVYLHGLPPKDADEEQWREKQIKTAHQRSGKIIEFLKREDSRAVRELASVPMLLQLVAVLWKDRRFRPRSRPALYDAALNYLLDYRDQEKDIEPFLPYYEARRVLSPAALWMQEELIKDAAPKDKMHAKMQDVLDTLAGEPRAKDFCEYLRDRAGLIADYDKQHYIFRHKSFREFLAGEELLNKANEGDCIQMLVSHFNEDWWEEPIRFFMSKVDDRAFDRFMELFFKSPVSRDPDAYHQTMLMNLVREAPQRKTDALAQSLKSERLNDRQRHLAMDCLKTIDTAKALEVIDDVDKSGWNEQSRSYAEKIVRQSAPVSIAQAGHETENSFFNPIEGNIEYIKIPGGAYTYSVNEYTETLPDLYFCKYPVTNQRYRRFIDYLSGKLKEYEERLPISTYAEKLRELAASVPINRYDGYAQYLGDSHHEWPGKFRTREEENKKFNGDDQPVVSVSWYAARAYCLWLSCLEPDSLYHYRLPTEIEWEWAAGGERDGSVSVREYPWPKEKGDLTPELANYGSYVGATTPVGLYPDGATPHGLMDMAGNVCEWMGNYYHEDKKVAFALRGGSWVDGVTNLRCSARYNNHPRYRWGDYGFRVLRAQS